LFILLSTGVIDARVTFLKSEVLDNIDLKDTDTATFRCSGGCRVYSPTMNDNIVIVDETGRKIASKIPLFTQMFSEQYFLQGGNYKLQNNNHFAPSFVFYAVEKGADNYDSKVYYVGS
ncbi:hypothetical protein PMAYCL1PPCAC_21748, partial [Pristionchus mayeri]